ncbi:trace amine-associated receptor 13c-like [Rhinichthys klamathensis goyatoka]|uniref:trace amine-associated receptor 13c-like n=1 Tax=Rhinichthys klamathensis goyatoka TaxID=3034132 RepID=UPI0024B56EE2|nr:trace amine-associated receptor 13c-like [Rhinichthys klamathensis goyatoka]
MDYETQYCFPGINSSCIKGMRSRYEYYIIYVCFSLLSAWTVFMNMLVIISISHFKKLHTPTNLIILSLAVADLLIGLIVIPIEGIRLTEKCWYFGDTFCVLFTIIFGLVFSASFTNLILIAGDRYVAVCHPLQYPQKITTTKTVITICLSWGCCLTYNVTVVIYNGYSNMCYGECYVTFGFASLVTDMVMSFIFPCTLLITLYLRIFYVVHQQVKVINSLMTGGKSLTEGVLRRKSESKAALTLGIIVIVYLLCFVPFFICSVSVNSDIILTVFAWVVYSNSGLNPLV